MSTKAPGSAAGRPSRRQGESRPPSRGWSVRQVIVAMGAVAVVAVVAISWTFIGADDSSAPDAKVDCGWDLSTTAGQEANAIYLNEAAQWIAARDPFSTETPPAPTSKYWRGECESKPVPPPIDEGHPHDE